jgi:hypothetical protein
MGPIGRYSLALLCSLAAFAAASYFSFLFLLLFDSNAHNGYSMLGGLIIGLVVGVFVFLTVAKKLST